MSYLKRIFNYLDQPVSEKKVKKIAKRFFWVGALGTSFLVGTAFPFDGYYTRKQDVSKFPQTEMTVSNTIVWNGKKYIETAKVPARVIPQSVLDNIKP